MIKPDIDEKIEALEEKIKSIEKENIVLQERIVVKTMFYDTFKDEMREKFGYDSDEEAERNWREVLERENSCDQCTFVGKSDVGLKTHKRKKHKETL